MGLEGVEIVMRVEEIFDIAIENSEAEKISTPRQLIDLVSSKVGRTTHAACLTQRAFHRLRAALMSQSRIKRTLVKPDTPLASLFPRNVRKERLRAVLGVIGLEKEMEFARPAWLHCLIFGTMCCGAIAVTIFYSRHPVASTSFVRDPKFGSPIVSGAVFFIVSGWLGFFATRGMRIEFRPEMNTAGELSRWIVAHGPAVVGAPPGQWSREQVAEHVRQIVIEVLCCEKEYREDAHFVKDLGMA